MLVVDAPADELPRIEGAEVLTPSQIGIDERELHRRAVLFDMQGLLSSLEPRLLRRALDEGAEAVLLVDADMLVLAPIDDVWSLASEAGALLSPHARAPLPGRPGDWAEEELLRSGAYNGGFLGIGSTGRPFLDWIEERVARDCLRAPERGVFYVQSWLNLVPALFPHHVLRDPGINAQIHGLDGEDVRWHDGTPWLGDAVLRLYHFAGFDPANPQRLCRYYPESEQVRLADLPGLAELCREYSRRVRGAGWPADYSQSWTTTAAGLPVDAPLRRAYRDGILGAERGQEPEPPDPFDAGSAQDMLAWLRTAPAGTSVSRYLLALRAERADLRAAFAQVPGPDEPAYLRWAAGKVFEERNGGRGEVPAEMAPA